MLKDLVVIVLVMSKLGISDYSVTNSYIKKVIDARNGKHNVYVLFFNYSWQNQFF